MSTVPNAIAKFVNLLISQLGYTETGENYTKYGKFFDTPKKDGGAWQFFNTHKNPAEWCALLLIWAFYVCFGEEATRKGFNLPEPKNNCGAGVKYLYEYMKKAGLLIKEPRPGCIVFFNTKTKKCAHVGACEYVDGKLHTIEGNKSNKVKRVTYTLTSSYIYAYAMPIFPDSSEYPVNVRTLKYVKGNTMKGEDVKSVQAIIGAKQDGSYGPDTERCVKTWQSAHGLKDDGSFGPKSWNTAVACGASSYPIYVRTLKYVKGNTMKGEDVKSVQAIVGAKQDGSYGPDTEKCVKAWQSAHKLEDDGSFGPKSWNTAIGAK